MSSAVREIWSKQYLLNVTRNARYVGVRANEMRTKKTPHHANIGIRHTVVQKVQLHSSSTLRAHIISCYSRYRYRCRCRMRIRISYTRVLLVERHRDYFCHYVGIHIQLLCAFRGVTCYQMLVQCMCIMSSPASGPGGSGCQDGGACLAAPLGTGLTAAVVVEGSSGSAGPPLGSCRLGAWLDCWGACVAGLAALERGCPRATPPCRCRRHSRRRLRAQGRSDRPNGG